MLIAKYSIPRVQKRIYEQRRKREEVDRLVEERDIEDYLNSIPNYEVKES